MKIFRGNEIIFKFMLINISSGIAAGMISFIIPIYALNLNATSTEIGLITGITGIGILLVVLPVGFLVDHFGSKKMYSISCVFGIAIILLLSFAADLRFLILAMVFYGMAGTLRSTSLSAAFFKNLTSIGTKRAGWYQGSMTLGGSFIGPIMGGIAAIAMGFTNYFIFTSAFLLLPLIVIIIFTDRKNNSPAKLGNSSFTDVSNQYKSLIKNRILILTTLIESLNIALFTTFTTFITVFAIKDLGLSPGIAAMLISLRGGATILVVFFCGQLLRRNNNNLYLFSSIITILALFLLGISTDSSLLAIASMILGIGTGLIGLIDFARVGNIDGEKGKIAGIFSFGQGTGAIIGPTLGGIIGDAFGLQTIFLAFMLPFFMLVVYAFMNSRKRI